MFITSLPSTNAHETVNPAPQRLILIVIVALCVGLLATAFFTFITLSHLRTDYLSNRGHEIASAIETQVRGPGKRNNPAFWQSVLDTSYENYAGSVAFLALIDQNGNILANSGKSPLDSIGAPGTTERDIYYFEEMLPSPARARSEGGHATAGWRISVGLNSANADFIQRMAFLQLIVSGLAIIALVVLSIYLIRMLNRFLELKAREGEAAQLKSLGIMAASLAHEIRNPLGAMKGLTQLAQEELPPDHASQTQLRTVVSEAERLEKLVTDLLDFARAREPQFNEFNFTELATDVQTMLQSKLNKSKAELRLSINPDPFNIRSDPAGLRQVLLNILINAIDATPAEGVVALTALHDKDHKSIVIRVDDSGEGFGGKDPEELFQPFVTTKVRGTGLGLAVTKQIVESLGGRLHLEDLPQGGARCSITLPIR